MFQHLPCRGHNEYISPDLLGDVCLDRPLEKNRKTILIQLQSNPKYVNCKMQAVNLSLQQL